MYYQWWGLTYLHVKNWSCIIYTTRWSCVRFERLAKYKRLSTVTSKCFVHNIFESKMYSSFFDQKGQRVLVCEVYSGTTTSTTRVFSMSLIFISSKKILLILFLCFFPFFSPYVSHLSHLLLYWYLLFYIWLYSNFFFFFFFLFFFPAFLCFVFFILLFAVFIFFNVRYSKSHKSITKYSEQSHHVIPGKGRVISQCMTNLLTLLYLYWKWRDGKD